MNLLVLRVQNLRCLNLVELELTPGINVFLGNNGAGKTSVLEAAFLLSHAQSFRSGSKETLIRRGADQLSVYAELQRANGYTNQLGLGCSDGRWSARIDGNTVSLGQLVHACAVVCFEPGTHALVGGGGEHRRRYLNWGLFHVEPRFLDTWRRYERALKQRNKLLRSGQAAADLPLFTPWERELAETGAAIDQQRAAYLQRLQPLLQESASKLLPELGSLELRYRRGWPETMDLQQALVEQRGKDGARGHTTLGAHRADWSLVFEGAPLREHLSRGQEKLAALACVLAQARLYALERTEWPVVCLDDFASELDEDHQEAVAAELLAAGAQVLLSGPRVARSLSAASSSRFHVERGEVARLL
jgi:DNA replication and repair protein RecF